MNSSSRFLNPAEAARRLGVSAKALRLYEQRGLVAPARNAAGWRSYGPEQMARGAEIVALRALGLSLAQVARVLDGDAEGLEPALAAHQTTLEAHARQLAGTIETVRNLRADLARGQTPTVEALTHLLAPTAKLEVEFELPWPWGGEPFMLRDIRPLNYIVGPLGSGKTRLALRLAEVLPDAAFLGLEREEDGSATTQLNADPALRLRVDQALAWLIEDGATASDALIALLAGLETEGPSVLVVDMVEQGLDHATQQAVIAHLRRRGPDGRPLFLLTRSCVILDLAAVGAHESIIFCPANHSPPTRVDPWPGAPGYEAVASCLASPEVRARTQGVIAWRPQSALHQRPESGHRTARSPFTQTASSSNCDEVEGSTSKAT
ncbi:MerR family transcriptional regulator [Variovorax sp. PAMC26660]|uniref:MerR family transcriptional regulator n=1 Tax=Variovorax sp. PAMC26660 TaxID=2762322 RepID=UPI00164E245E|nr:MerR family transcriptional regulator [Variovorax sp. PAMC26660]QNK66546.1 MerR family transcriptional regulator [Variovorax sp. PAMC26660]